MRTGKRCYLFAVVLFLIPSLVYSSQETLSLIVLVSGATPGKGQAICSLFTSSDTYLKKPAIKETRPIDSKGEVEFRINDLAPGTYAVSIVYDEDSNGKLNTGIFGIPTELVGMSNNAKGTFGPPTYEKTAFELSASSTIRISLGKAKE